LGVIVYTLYSFAKDNIGGNLAGVVLDADHLSDVQMLNIANQVGFSETAFVHKSNKATFKVRFFTPNSEVDLCGHATIATFSLLRSKGLIGDGIFSQETKAGILNITVGHDNVYMNQILPKYYDILDKAEIADSLNLSLNDFLTNLPAQIVSTGLKDVIVAVKSIKILSSIQPDFEKISELSKKYNVIGYHVFSLETKFGSTAHCRNFAPLYDIKEESATGTSNGALACYLHNYGIINKDQSSELVFEQGYSIGKPSEILVRLKIKKDKISEVLVGGTAIIRDELTFEQL
jgi:PhzF family phenazine biosynthesis protein